MTEEPPKDWEAIAKEIWDEYDSVALYLEDYMNQKNGVSFPFLEKNLPRRFKYFNRYHGRTVTADQFEKEKHLEGIRMDSLRDMFLKP